MLELSTQFFGMALALLAAGVWGSGDYAGGMAVRRADPFQVIVLAALSGMVLLLVIAVFVRETWPSTASMLWSLAAGSSGALGLTALYAGIARGRAAVVAPTTAVVGAIIPVGFGLVTRGLLTNTQVAGIALALVGLWLVSRPASQPNDSKPSGLSYGLLAGVGVSGFLIFIAQVDEGHILLPLVVARVASVVVGLIILLSRGTPMPRLAGGSFALAAGLFDAGGNVLYLWSENFIRIDIAAVLSSMYPVITVLLARWLMKQAVSKPQWVGLFCCLGGVTLIAL
jgi:drug/metabolite transporter (DMT)-like permease